MSLSTNPLLILKDPEIRKYFVSILESNLSGDEKYERLIDFFRLEQEVKTEMLNSYGDELNAGKIAPLDELASAAGQKLGIWKPDEILMQTHKSIVRALHRVKNTQYDDGGWRFEPEQQSAWGTAFAVLCLNTAKHFPDFDVAIDDNLENGLRWLKEHLSEWAVEDIATTTAKTYDLSIVIRCCYEAGVNFPALERAWRKLVEAQNNDGGWDDKVWADNHNGLTRVYSDVGATRMALEALATVKRYQEPDAPLDLGALFLNGMQWFIRTQNKDGSWNNKSCSPNSEGIEGYPSITKTCDGIKGILTASDRLPELNDKHLIAANDAVDKAVNWLLSKEKALFDQTGIIAGWGWGEEMSGGDLRIDELHNTWLTLETLVQVNPRNISLPLLTANAQWLMKQQHQATTDEDPREDGKWEPMGHTARITLSLIEFYTKTKGSPLFKKEEVSAATVEAAS
ncbi:MAG TPA: prenyltransferase/squalene oxidase repeat-containing protein [Pyrinomonadaceae bacterium]|nr:prenyltransferase/squalene oxidase repeat-containing protein [Pyrinomonadaceae bacterium]